MFHDKHYFVSAGKWKEIRHKLWKFSNFLPERQQISPLTALSPNIYAESTSHFKSILTGFGDQIFAAWISITNCETWEAKKGDNNRLLIRLRGFGCVERWNNLMSNGQAVETLIKSLKLLFFHLNHKCDYSAILSLLNYSGFGGQIEIMSLKKLRNFFKNVKMDFVTEFTNFPNLFHSHFLATRQHDM